MACVLEAAVWSPNHHLAQPRRFFALTGDAHHLLGKVLASGPTLPPAKREAARQKPLCARVVIAVALEPAPERSLLTNAAPGPQRSSTYAGLCTRTVAARFGATGRAFEVTLVQRFFDLSARALLLGSVSLGYPAALPAPPPRRPARCTVWIEDGQVGQELRRVLPDGERALKDYP
ncbi:MAG: nitroreductase [Thermomicrobium sp.]